MKKKTMIFDLDGTLLDTLEDLKNSVNYALEMTGNPIRTLDEIRQFVGNGILLLMERAVPGGRENPSFDKALAFFKEHYGVHCNDLTKPYEGIMDLIQVLKENGIKATVTIEEGTNEIIKGLPQSLYVLKRYNMDESVTKEKLQEILEEK